jgi:hypothetical protein
LPFDREANLQLQVLTGIFFFFFFAIDARWREPARCHTLARKDVTDVTEIGDLALVRVSRTARAREACPETLAAISFGRHHRLRGRGAEDRESVAPAAPSVATQPTRRVPSRSFRMGFFNDKSGNPAYILAEKVRRRGCHARLATLRAVPARARPRPTRVCRESPATSRVSPRTNASRAKSESRRDAPRRDARRRFHKRKRFQFFCDAVTAERG